MANKKLLITGFDPFGGEPINSGWEAVKALPDQIGSYKLYKLQIPTVFGEAAQKVLSTAKTLSPDVIVCIGQAGGRSAITPERLAINLQDARIPDNAGQQPVETPCIAHGPAAFFATVPVKAMTQAIVNAFLPGQVSLSAGSFVCNDTLYTLLHHYNGTDMRVGFIHVPHLPQQAKEGAPSMPLDDIITGLTAAIRALSDD